MDPQSERHLIELVEWLERAGHEASFFMFLRGLRNSCAHAVFRADPDRIRSEGLVTTEFIFPLSILSKAGPVDDEALLGAWLDTISTNGIEASIVDFPPYGRSVQILRHDYVPKERREEWIAMYGQVSTDVVNAIRKWQFATRQADGEKT